MTEGRTANEAYRLAGATPSEVATPSRVDVISQDMHIEIQRFHVPLATRTAPKAGVDGPHEERNLDFIGNIHKWGDQRIVGLFGPDILFADMVLMSQLSKLRQDLPKSLVRRFVNGPSYAEIAYYYYRYHLARSRHSSSTRTQSPRTKRRRIYPFVVEEYPNDPTGSLLKLTLEHPSIELPEDQKAGRPNVALVFELLSALSAWAFQTTHTLVPDETILKILLQTQATESEFASLRAKLARNGMQIFTPDADMVKSRAWIPLGGDLSWEPVDDVEHSDEEEPGQNGVAVGRSPQPDFHPISNSLLGSRTDLAITYNAQGEPTKVQHSAGLRPDSPSLVGPYQNTPHTLSMKVQRLRAGSSPKLPVTQENPTDLTRPRASSRMIGSPQLPGGTTNPPLHPIRDIHEEAILQEPARTFWPEGAPGNERDDDETLDPAEDWANVAEAQIDPEPPEDANEGAPPRSCGCIIQ